MTLFEAQDASEIVASATGGDVNIILGTSVNEQLADEIVVTVIATGIDPGKKERPMGQRNNVTTQGMVKRQTRPVPEVKQTEAVETQTASAGAFGDWDIRREPNTRNVPDETQFESIEKRDFDTFSNTESDHTSDDDDDELSTPPFVRRKK